MERGCVSLVYNMVNDHFYSLSDFTPNQRKSFLKTFSQEFTPLYRAQLNATVFPGATTKFVTHYGYYVDSENLEDFFADMNEPTDEHVKFAAGCCERLGVISQKYQELDVTEMECASLTAIVLFTILDRQHLHPDEARAKRDTVFAELNRYLVFKVGFDESGIRFGRLLLFLQDCINLTTYLNESLVLARIFMPNTFNDVWDEEPDPETSEDAEQAAAGTSTS